MKNNRELLEIVRIVSAFKLLKIEQVKSILGCSDTIAGRLIKRVEEQGRIFIDYGLQMVAESPEYFDKPDKKTIAAFWVFLKFFEKSDYYTYGEFPVCISFFAEGEHYEIIYVAYGNEITVNHILSQWNEESKRLVIVESKEQIQKLDIPSLLSFCMVDDMGEVTFYKIE